MEEGKMPLRITRRQIMKSSAIAGLAGFGCELLGGTSKPRLAEAEALAEKAATETKLTACWIGKQGWKDKKDRLPFWLRISSALGFRLLLITGDM
jgi:hypothetical protein